MSAAARAAPISSGVDQLVTIVIPTLNEERSISSCLDSVLSQTYSQIEVLVLDGGSDDRTRAIVENYASRDARVMLLENPRRIQSAAMNMGLEAARGVYLVRIDAHATVAPTYIASAVAHLSTGEWGGVGGRKDAVGFTPTGRAIAAVLGSPFGVGNSAYHHATSSQTVDHIPFGCYVTDAAREIGGWSEQYSVNEDFEFDLRMRTSGRPLLLDPSMVIAWEGRPTIKLLARQYRRYGRGKSKVVLAHPAATSPRHLAAPGIVAMLALAALIAPWRPKWSFALVAPYLFVLTAGSISVAATLPTPEERRAVPAALAAMHLSWGVGFWEGIAGADVVQRSR